MQDKAEYQSPIGKLDILLEDGFIVAIDIKHSTTKPNPNNDQKIPVLSQLHAYFSGKQKEFDLPLQLEGTSFQQKVWREMQKIPAGKTLSYGDIAKCLGSNPRAVGNACRANPVPVIVPCHRVVAKSGLGGYAGKTSGRLLAIKKWLLLHEGASIVKGTG